MSILRCLALLAVLPAAAMAEGMTPVAVGPWTCLTADGSPAFAFAIGDEGTYRDPEGVEGTFQQPGPGMIDLLSGTWAGAVGSHVPGVMALMLPGAKVPVICRSGA
jgi:hypothetical protein